jgi:hypothetical protein
MDIRTSIVDFWTKNIVVNNVSGVSIFFLQQRWRNQVPPKCFYTPTNYICQSPADAIQNLMAVEASNLIWTETPKDHCITPVTQMNLKTDISNHKHSYILI